MNDSLLMLTVVSAIAGSADSTNWAAAFTDFACGP